MYIIISKIWKRAKMGHKDHSVGTEVNITEGSGGVVSQVPEEQLIAHGEEGEEQEFKVMGSGGEAVVEVVIELLEDEEVGPEVAVSNLLQDEVVPAPGEGVHDLEGDKAPGVELDNGGVEH